MIDDLRDLPKGAKLQADLCVIGAGAAGIALAREFAGARHDVIVLESGGLRRSDATDRFKHGESNGMDVASLVDGRGRLLGGSTALWAGQCIPLDRGTFAERPWIPHSGWPFEGTELEPFLRRAEALFQIQGEVYDERVWDAFGVRRPAVDPGALVHRFTVWCPQPHLGRLYRDALDASRHVRVLLNATATEIVTTPGGQRFDSVQITTPEGRQASVSARACVLCCGGIENSRLLLASQRHQPAGIGNRHDLVGRFFQEHPNGHAAVIVEGDVARLQELYGLLYRRRIRYLPRLVLSRERQRSEEVLACAAHPVFHFGEQSGIEAARRLYRAARGRHRPQGLPRELTRIARDAPRLFPVAYRRVAHGRSPRAQPVRVTLQTYGEQAPNPASRITLSRQRDPLGVALPKVDWQLTAADLRTAEVMVSVVTEEFRRLGLGTVRAEPWLADGSWSTHMTEAFHHMGTTRLGTDPKSSVVDPNGQVHGVDGLFVTGSSVFPIAGFANPTLTIAALAIRLGDHLKRSLDGRSEGAADNAVGVRSQP